MRGSRSTLLAACLLVAGYAQAEEKNQSLDSIYMFVRETVAQRIDPATEHEITVLPLDDQLRLASCPVPLEAFKADSLIKAGRVSIGVRCNGGKKWSIFVSAIIKAYASVIVLTRAVQRGDIISRDYLAMEKKDISQAHGDFATAFEQVENKQAVRNFPVGAILGLKSVVQPPAVRRKDKVIITSGQGGYAVQMSGTALMDGSQGQVIKVKNDSSGRVVSGTVVAPGVVLIK